VTLMLGLSRKGLIDRLDHGRIERAIQAAERRTSGEIRVSVAPFFLGRVEHAARRAFQRLGMHQTRERNGILFFIVPSRRAFFVLGDEGIHARVGADFWRELADAMSPRFRAGQFTDGILLGISAAAERLEQHFPFSPTNDVNELPDDVDLQ